LCKYEECIGIFFDDKKAVDYFRGDFDHSGLSQDCVFEYKKVRDKHVAYIYSW
jgi:hypothetical protein